MSADAELVTYDPVMVARAIVRGETEGIPKRVLDGADVGAALVQIRREVVTRTADAVYAAVNEGLTVARKHVKANPEDAETALAMVRAASPLVPKGVLQVEVLGGGAQADLIDDVEWLLAQAEEHRIRLELGAAAELDGIADAEIVPEGWDLL